MGAVLRLRWLLVVQAVALIGVLALLLYESRQNKEPWELIGGLFTVTVAAVAAGRAPLIGLAAASTSSIAMLFSFDGRIPLWPVVLMFAMSYPAGRRTQQVKPALLSFVSVSLIGVPISMISGQSGIGRWAAMVSAMLIAGVLPWQLAMYARLRDELVRAGWQRAEQLEKQQRIVADEARLRERARIAADMHDSLGHELSLIALRAGAMEVDSRTDEWQRTEAGALRENASTATERLRDIIGVLRSDVDPAPIEPVDETIQQLIDRARSSGMTIESNVDPIDKPSSMVARAAHRVVQEGLTNVTKHAQGAPVTVLVSRARDVTTVTVRNGLASLPLSTGEGGRRGLAGLRERVRLVGGTLVARRLSAGFEIIARLPHDAAPVGATSATDAEVSDSVLAHEDAKRKARHGLLSALAVPVGFGLAVLGVASVMYVYNWYSTQLRSSSFNRMELGQPRVELAAELPSSQRDEHTDGSEPAAPIGASCEYYGADASVLEFSGDFYRLCFAEGRLASKDLIRESNHEAVRP